MNSFTRSIAALGLVAVAILGFSISSAQARPMRMAGMSHNVSGNCALCHQQTASVQMAQLNNMRMQETTNAPAMQRQRPSPVHRVRVMPVPVQPMMATLSGGIPVAPAVLSGSGPGDAPGTPNRADPPPPVLPPEVQRSRNNPPVTEINSAKALNDLLVYLATQPTDRDDAAPIELDASVLASINVTSARSGAGFGVLRNGGRFNWPLALQDLTPDQEAQQLRKQVESQVQDAVNQGREGRVEESFLTQLRGEVDQLRTLLKRSIQRFSPSSYLEAKRFLNDLDDALKVLREPDVAQYVNGRYAARGRTVAELLRYMNANQLTFAPAVAGDESTYAKLRQALVAASKPALASQR